MSGIVYRKNNSNVSLTGTQYVNPTTGTMRLCVRDANGNIVKYGFTTNTSASLYSPAFYVNSVKCYVGLQSRMSSTIDLISATSRYGSGTGHVTYGPISPANLIYPIHQVVLGSSIIIPEVDNISMDEIKSTTLLTSVSASTFLSTWSNTRSRTYSNTITTDVYTSLNYTIALSSRSNQPNLHMYDIGLTKRYKYSNGGVYSYYTHAYLTFSTTENYENLLPNYFFDMIYDQYTKYPNYKRYLCNMSGFIYTYYMYTSRMATHDIYMVSSYSAYYDSNTWISDLSKTLFQHHYVVSDYDGYEYSYDHVYNASIYKSSLAPNYYTQITSFESNINL